MLEVRVTETTIISEVKVNNSTYFIITDTSFKTWIRDITGKAIAFYRCKDSISVSKFHDVCIKRFMEECNNDASKWHNC